jgi:predicted DsbA family dithiol-disulfide isomerase
MTTTRNVEMFSAGCPACDEAISQVQDMACPSCEITIHDMRQQDVAQRAKELGIRRVPAVVVDGQPVACCQDSGFNERALRDAGIGQRFDRFEAGLRR